MKKRELEIECEYLKAKLENSKREAEDQESEILNLRKKIEVLNKRLKLRSCHKDCEHLDEARKNFRRELVSAKKKADDWNLISNRKTVEISALKRYIIELEDQNAILRNANEKFKSAGDLEDLADLQIACEDVTSEKLNSLELD